MRLRRSDPSAPGYRRRGRRLLDQNGNRLSDPDALARIRELAVPPAWRDVWISPDPRGHIQAVGTDAAGRRQYLYHEAWRREREKRKFDHVLDVAERLPRLRRRLARDLTGDRLSRDRVLAAVVRLIDLGLFRVGGDEYAKGEEATFGVTTLLPEHVRITAADKRRLAGPAQVPAHVMEFRYPAKGGIERVCAISDDEVCAVLTQLRRRRDRSRLFAYRDPGGWHDVRGDEVNGYLKDASGIEMTAKDFRTWHATVLAAILLAEHDPAGVPLTGRRRTVARVMRDVAEELGNTPAVAKASYVDPRVVDLYHDGATVAVPRTDSRTALERAVLTMLRNA
jgi:DNA topoisomerase I